MEVGVMLRNLYAKVANIGRATRPITTPETDQRPESRNATNDSIAIIRDSGLLDAEWYLEANQDLYAAGVDPFEHYVVFGWKEGRDPNPSFHSRWYLENNPDVAAHGINPLVHYVLFGEKEGRKPCLHFDPVRYRAASGLSDASTGLLLVHYLKNVHRVTTLKRLDTISRVYNAKFQDQNRKSFYTESVYRPLISIIIPTYNSNSVYLREAIESVRQQSYENWQLCLVDDGSKDADCLAVLKAYENCDKRVQIQYLSKNSGIAHASQVGLEMSKGQYIGFVDHDDILGRGALEAIVNFLSKEPSTDYVYTDHAMISESGDFLHGSFKPAWSPEFLLSTNYIVHFKVIRKDILEKIKGFRTNTHVIQDLDLTIRVVEAEAKVRHLPIMAYFWRQHPLSVASGTSAKPAIERLALEIYNGYLDRRSSSARAIWPFRFRASKTGAYKLQFPAANLNQIAVVIVVRSGETIVWDRLNCLLAESGVNTHFVFLDDPLQHTSRKSSYHYHRAKDQADLNRVIESIEAEKIVFVRPTAELLNAQWLEEITGYLDLDQTIGAVGGKVLDRNLRVVGGGVLLLDQPAIIAHGESDNFDGVWFAAQIASNVEAVSSGLMAVRKSELLAMGGLPVFEFGDDAGLALCLSLRLNGSRVVFNPWSKVVDGGKFFAPNDAKALLNSKFKNISQYDRYYNPNYSKSVPYLLT